jgi:hypothetical protein
MLASAIGSPSSPVIVPATVAALSSSTAGALVILPARMVTLAAWRWSPVPPVWPTHWLPYVPWVTANNWYVPGASASVVTLPAALVQLPYPSPSPPRPAVTSTKQVSSTGAPVTASVTVIVALPPCRSGTVMVVVAPGVRLTSRSSGLLR